MRDSARPGNGTMAGKRFRLFWKTWPVRDFANFGHRGRRAISLGRKTGPLAAIDFAYPENVAGARFHLAGARCHRSETISLISENADGARFR